MKEVVSAPGGGLHINLTPEKVNLARRVFNPHQPISNRDLFSGRVQQLNSAVIALRTPGIHPVVFGVRGVGKTSLANVIKIIAGAEGYKVCSHTCSSSSTFSSIMRALFSTITAELRSTPAGFGHREKIDEVNLDRVLQDDYDQGKIVSLLSGIGVPILLVIDEFDRVPHDERRKMSDLVKIASDNAGDIIKILLVGVGETVEDLVKDHPSVKRNLAEIHVSLMSGDEISEIISKGGAELDVKFPASIAQRIVTCAQGFPYFAHLISQHSVICAIEKGNSSVAIDDFLRGLRSSIDNVDYTIRREYNLAVTSNKKSSFADVLYAASQAKCDEFGFFTAKQLTTVPAKRDNSQFSLQAVQYPLSKLTTQERGGVLRREGSKGNIKYKFSNPMMRQYVVMRRMTE